jgi:hypothetical protein
MVIVFPPLIKTSGPGPLSSFHTEILSFPNRGSLQTFFAGAAKEALFLPKK